MNTTYFFIKFINHFLFFWLLAYFNLLRISDLISLFSLLLMLLFCFLAGIIVYLFMLVWLFWLIMLLLDIFEVLWSWECCFLLFCFFRNFLFGCFGFSDRFFGKETKFVLLLSIKIDQFVLLRLQFWIFFCRWIFSN